MSTSAGSCPTCGSAVAAESRFCPQCGTRMPTTDGTAVLDTPPHETSRAPVELLHAEPRFYGVTPPMTVLVLAVAAAAAAVLLLVRESTIAGVLMLALAAALVVGFVVLAKREAVRNARERAGSLFETLAVRGRVRQEVLRIRQELDLLARERERALSTLGRTAYAGDDEGMEAARQALRDLDDQLSAKEAQMQTIVSQAQERIHRSRLQADSTNIIEPPQPPGPADPGGPVPIPEPYPPPDEGDPPVPAPVPEPYPPDEAEPPPRQ